MRIYTSFKDALNETCREVFTRGRTVFDKTVQGRIVEGKEFEQKEIIGYGFAVVIKNLDEMLKEMMDYAREIFEKDWLTSEVGDKWFKEMLEPKNPDEWWKGTGLEEYWKGFGIEDDGRFSYTYGERLSITIPQVIQCLKRNKYMRGAVATAYESSKDLSSMGKRRTPCTMYFQFLIRSELDKDTLTTIYTARSQDLVSFFPLDVYKAAKLGQHIADKVEVKFKYYMHFVGSLHCYKKDIPKDRQW